MDFTEYQILAHRTSGQSDFSKQLTLSALGLAGEAGEFCDIVKKVLFHEHPLDTGKLVLELGDILWYIAEAATALGIAFDAVAKVNIDKLKKRYPDGFSSERSINREE